MLNLGVNISEYSCPHSDILVTQLLDSMLRGNAEEINFNEIEFPPRLNPQFLSPPNLITIELDGISDSGKTSCALSVCERLTKLGIHCYFQQDLEVVGDVNDERLAAEIARDLSGLKRKDDYVFKDKLIELGEGLKLLALESFVRILNKDIPKISANPYEKYVYIKERGPSDSLALVEWSIGYSHRINEALGRSNYSTDEKKRINFVMALMHTMYFQSVVMFYIKDLEILLERRRKQKKQYKAVMANSEDFPLATIGYKKYLKYIHPSLFTGLLMIDGRDEVESNTDKVISHITDCFKRRGI